MEGKPAKFAAVDLDVPYLIVREGLCKRIIGLGNIGLTGLQGKEVEITCQVRFFQFNAESCAIPIEKRKGVYYDCVRPYPKPLALNSLPSCSRFCIGLKG